MKQKELKFLEKKLLELVENKIITKDQYDEAYNFFNTKKEKKYGSIVFTSIGLLLIGLSIITLFAIKWSNIPREIKCIIAFIPLIITSIIFYISLTKENKNLQIATSIIAPISILATNSLLGQIFHIEGSMKELIFLSLLMFMPIAFIIKNHITLIVYGIGAVFYSVYIENYTNEFLIILPLIIYNLYNFIMKEKDKKNIIVWIFNVCIMGLLLFTNEVIGGELLIFYLYIMSLITKLLFKKDNKLSKVISSVLMFFLYFVCLSSFVIDMFSGMEFGLDTLICMIISISLFIATKEYKDINECIILLFILISNLHFINANIMFVLFNVIVLGYGVYRIIYGYKKNLPKVTKKGIASILYIIFLRFISSEMLFATKSILFLMTGILFIVGSKLFKKKIEEGKKDEEK